MESGQVVINKLVTGARHGLFGTVGGRFLGVLGSVIAARILGPAAFGLYAIGWTLLRFLSLIFPLGMDRALLKFAPRYWNKDPEGLKGLLFQTISLSLGTGFLFGLVLFSLAPWLSSVVYKKPELLSVFRLFSIVFPLLSLLIVVAAATRVTQSVKISVLLQDLGQPLLGLILILAFYLLGIKLTGVILSDVISIAFATVVGIFLVSHVFPEIITVKGKIKDSLKEVLAYSIPAALAGAFSVYVFWIDRILVGYFLPSFENGIYLAVSQISTIFLVISAGINSVVVPIFSDLFFKNDTGTLEEVYRISTKWGIYISVPIIIVFVASPGDTLSLIYGESYRIGGNVFLILLIGQLVNLITGSVNPLMIMTGNQKYLFKLSGIMLVLTVVLNLFLIPKYGLTGAAASTSISLSLLYIVALLWVKRKLDLWPYDRRYIKGLIAGIASALVVIIIKTLFSEINQWNIIIQGFGAIIIFISVLYFLKFDQEDSKFIQVIGKKHGVNL
jgi:O-antigen/teichoic acid export membrane protein